LVAFDGNIFAKRAEWTIVRAPEEGFGQPTLETDGYHKRRITEESSDLQYCHSASSGRISYYGSVHVSAFGDTPDSERLLSDSSFITGQDNLFYPESGAELLSDKAVFSDVFGNADQGQRGSRHSFPQPRSDSLSYRIIAAIVSSSRILADNINALPER
jgi:hypothetical protein